MNKYYEFEMNKQGARIRISGSTNDRDIGRVKWGIDIMNAVATPAELIELNARPTKEYLLALCTSKALTR